NPDCYFNHPLEKADSLLIVSMLLILVLNLIAGIPRQYANFGLRSHRLLLEMAFSENLKNLLETPPMDIRTVRMHFDMEPTLMIYAACPCFSCIYAPREDDGNDIGTKITPSSSKKNNTPKKPPYPEICMYNPLPKDPASSPCRESLLKKKLPQWQTETPTSICISGTKRLACPNSIPPWNGGIAGQCLGF
ncbi:hypothetical protein K439DRAFT_1377409, partial [Ramaria rubella]